MSPERVQMRRHLLQSLYLVACSDAARSELRELRELFTDTMEKIAAEAEANGLLAPGVSAQGFARFWTSSLFGQVIYEMGDEPEIAAEEWIDTLMAAASGLVRPITPLGDELVSPLGPTRLSAAQSAPTFGRHGQLG
jgi:hypothetical protein